MYMLCECVGSGGGSVSWDLLWNVSARPVLKPWDGQTWNQSGKAPQRGGRRMTRVWMGVGGKREGRGGLSLYPRPQETPGPTVPWKEPLWGPGCPACIGLRPQTHRLPAWYIYVLFYHSLSRHKQSILHVFSLHEHYLSHASRHTTDAYIWIMALEVIILNAPIINIFM